MATGAADFMFRCVSDGSLSMCDMDIERRPYHRNCKCALHKMKGKCLHTDSQHKNISFPKREFSKKNSYSVSTSTISSKACYVHNSSLKSKDSINEDSEKRMATGAADFMFRCVFDGSLSMTDMDIERRPYHKNYKCALHKMKGNCSHAGSQQRNISFPKRKCSFAISSAISSQSSHVQNTTRSREYIEEGSDIS
ncbi:hypothetical protein BUALT_Bualt16G0081400 [Buddleja alternifolia]|uniref:Uncharacterized protein n=1 Tax=Buddleja alternifolia TaxID=168488 RepID=A0AAV6WKN3_9LAMI|nr:hypothetical protein BUALT_Bualt16G0081400 [Buddleja alternifolia]